jgi:hypothetical protein
VTIVSGTLTWVRLTAAVGLVFSALAIVAGTRVLTGRDVPDYQVLPWLVQYNVAAGAIGAVVALSVWWGRPWARLAAGALAAVHGGVLLILVATRLTGGVVANDSLLAMTLRATVWLGVALVAHRASPVRG